MRARRARALPSTLVSAGLMVLVSGCGLTDGSTVGAVPGSAPASGEAAPATKASSGQGGSEVVSGSTRKLPNLVGKGLQVAQDRAQAAGFRKLASHDALGRKRVQVFDRDWKVCSQSPAAGSRAADTRVDFGVVKLSERCPGKDQGQALKMPKLTGKSAAIAVAELGLDVNITWRDGMGAGRKVLLPTNWLVCAQSPKAGAKYYGVPVTLTVIKKGEKC